MFLFFQAKSLLALSSTLKLEYHPLSDLRNFLFSISAAANGDVKCVCEDVPI